MRTLTTVLVPALGAVFATTTAQTLPRLTVTRDVVVDGRAESLTFATHTVVGTDGTIYVPDTQNGRLTDQVIIFGPDGRRRTVLGRNGSGPGEFRSVFNTGTVGDSLWVFDVNSRRVTVAGPDGKVLRMFTPTDFKVSPGLKLRDSKMGGTILALLGDGGMILRGSIGGTDHMRTYYPGYPLMRITPARTIDGILAWEPFDNGTLFSKDVQGGIVDVPFPNRWVRAIAPDGSAYAVVVAAINDDVPSATVTVIRAEGDTAFRQRIPVSAQPIPADVLDNAYAIGPPGTVSSRLGELARQKNGAKLVALVRAAPRPRFYPPLEGVWISRSHQVLGSFRTDAPERDFLVIDATGRPTGTLRLPRGAAVRQFDGAVIWAYEHDRDGIPSVVRYRVQ